MTPSVRRFAAAWVDAVRRRAAWVLAVAALATAGSAWYSATHFAIDTNPDEMLSEELPYRRKGLALSAAFPQYANSIVVVIDGPNADLVDRAATELTATIEKRPDLFHSVFDPAGMRFFRENGLLYLDVDELSDLVDRLAEAQPLLGTLWADPNLPGLLDVLRRAVEEARKGEAPIEVGFVFERVAGVVEAAAAGRTGYLSWQELMRGRDLDPLDRRRIVIFQPVVDYNSLAPAGAALDGVREIERELDLEGRYGTQIRITGPTALETEELRSISQGMGLATTLSTLLVMGLLVWGLRSLRLVAATLLTLFAGLIVSVALAFATVGRLNLVSVAFAVLFVGLSVDFGIHYALRFREGLDGGDEPGAALRDAAEGVGGSLALCAVAAAIGFFSFLPTDYVGLAELGWIAGVSMFVALVANLTILPAFLAVAPPPAAPGQRQAAGAGDPDSRGFVQRHAWAIALVSGAAAVAAAVLSSQARFDPDPLKLRDPESESVRTLFELAAERRSSPYRVVELAPDLQTANRLAERAAKLETVRDTMTASDFVPKNQDEKLEILYSASLFLLPALSATSEPEPPSAAERRRSVDAFREELRGMIASAPGEAAPERRLAAAFDALESSRGLGPEVLGELERRLVTTLPGRLADLRLSLGAGAVGLDDVPEALRARWIGPRGEARLEISPEKTLHDDPVALREFARDVQTVLPEAAGMPIDIVEAGRAIVGSFVEATMLSMILIGGLVAILVRRLRDVLLIFAPLVLAGLLTVASTVVLGTPFNFANVIVLPLLFGLGVASGIHLVLRERDEAGGADVLETSTPRAVVFSALTTIGSFGSLAVVNHPGTASMGVLLTVAIAMTLVCTLVSLPALMEIFPAYGPAGSSDAGGSSSPAPESPPGSSSSRSRS